MRSILLLGGFVLLLSACSEQEQQETARDMSQRDALEKAEQVQRLIDEKAAADRRAIEEAARQ